MSKNSNYIKHRGRWEQIPLFLNKLFRLFIFMNDWKVIPMSALVAGITSIVVAKDMFVNMEGTLKGALALSCICIWNGFFNSIQSICRERDVIKREHRNGMHISSYVIAHMIYQAFICLLQTVITIFVCKTIGMQFKTDYMDTVPLYFYIGTTLFLITYSADMMSLLISGIAKSTTSAMTVMPFMLIFELVFSNSIFKLEGSLSHITDLSIAKWGIRCIAAQANYNSLPMVSTWKQLSQWEDLVYEGTQPFKILMNNVSEEEFCMLTAQKSQVADYITSTSNIVNCWIALGVFAVIFAFLTIIVLKRIDSDKR